MTAVGTERLATLVGFTRRLADAGLPVGTDRTQTFLAAVAALGTQPAQIYWSGRLTLCTRPDDFRCYDTVFRQVFGERAVPAELDSPSGQPRVSLLSTDDDDATAADASQARAMASRRDLLRRKDFGLLTPQERREIHALMALVRTDPPQRRVRRRRPASRGPLDRRRSTRAIVAAAGEPVKPLRHKHSQRPRRIVLLIDVSGSMEPYADALLRFAHQLVRASPRTVEVFTVGTRLTRITRAFTIRDPQRALAAAADTIADYSGGTRLGEVLQVFVSGWGRRGAARGAVAVVFSDGWERGSPELLGQSAEQLKRLVHTLIWVNPHKGKQQYQPVQSGIAAVLAHLDALVAGHSLAALEELLDVMRRA